MKIIKADEAAVLVGDGDSLLIGGFGSYDAPEELLAALETRYDTQHEPKNLTVMCGISVGDKLEIDEPHRGYNLGINRLKAEGLIDKYIAGNLTDPRAIAYMVGENKIACFLPPLGVMLNLFRAAASGRPGVLTRVGLKTFADPRLQGCAFNDRARELPPIVELITLGGSEYLFYKTFDRADAAFIRATFADEDGNLSTKKEGVLGPELDIAAAVHAKGGIVIAQVEQVVRRGTIPAKEVRIPGVLVDYVVICSDPVYHKQCYATDKYRPEISGETRIAGEAVRPLKMSLRKVLARRGAMELSPGKIVNLGTGIPSGISSVAAEEGIEDLTYTVEAGSIGGFVQEGLSFPGVANAEAYVNQLDMLDIYDGGLIDMAFLGFAEADEQGNANVSFFAGRAIGAGGYINISQSAKKVFFLGNFSAGKPDIITTGSGLEIKQDDAPSKFVKQVQHITFSGEFALENGQEVTYITERAVFRLTPEGMLLTEIAEGVDLTRDILEKIPFEPIVSQELKKMDAKIFMVNHTE